MDLVKYEKIFTSQQIQTYQQVIELINFAAVITRSNIAKIAFKFSKFFTNSSKFHMKSINQILKNLSHTNKLTIEFNMNLDSLTIFLTSSDASFVDDIET
jgi:hypothetical protein